MKKHLAGSTAALSLWMLCAGCNAPGREREYDTARVRSDTPTLDVPPDSTAGVARSTGKPGVAGDTVSRSSNISAPPGKTPGPKRP